MFYLTLALSQVPTHLLAKSPWPAWVQILGIVGFVFFVVMGIVYLVVSNRKQD
jgi:hypothetical protein